MTARYAAGAILDRFPSGVATTEKTWLRRLLCEEMTPEYLTTCRRGGDSQKPDLMLCESTTLTEDTRLQRPVRNHWDVDSYVGHLFVFVGRRADRCKFL